MLNAPLPLLPFAEHSTRGDHSSCMQGELSPFDERERGGVCEAGSCLGGMKADFAVLPQVVGIVAFVKGISSCLAAIILLETFKSSS
jgi:hypothetical protein